MIKIYTDGSCLGNPGPGGAGIVIFDSLTGEMHRKLSVPSPGETTNNRAEMIAVVIALRWAQKNPEIFVNQEVKLYSDSNYTVKGMTEWRKGWQARNYNNVKNDTLWKQLHAEHDKVPFIDINWVKGHDKDKMNQLADTLARQAADECKKNLR